MACTTPLSGTLAALSIASHMLMDCLSKMGMIFAGCDCYVFVVWMLFAGLVHHVDPSYSPCFLGSYFSFSDLDKGMLLFGCDFRWQQWWIVCATRQWWATAAYNCTHSLLDSLLCLLQAHTNLVPSHRRTKKTISFLKVPTFSRFSVETITKTIRQDSTNHPTSVNLHPKPTEGITNTPPCPS